MFKGEIKKAFTLIELLVGISILTIIIMGATSIDYNRLSMKQKLEIFTNSIKSDFETIRNNSLSGRGVGIDLDIPQKWKIDYSNTGSGSISSSTTVNGVDWIINNNLQFQPGFYISKISCLRLNGTLDNEIDSGIGTIEFSGDQINLGSDCTSITSKILEIEITHRVDKKIIQFNTLNGLVNIK